MEMPLTELFNIDWRETSFVSAGDNPPARIVMWKDRPELTDEEIETILAEAENERRSTVTDPIQQANELAKRDYPELAKTSPAAARAKVWAERPDLREAHEQAEETPIVVEHTVEKGAPALAKRDAAVA